MNGNETVKINENTIPRNILIKAATVYLNSGEKINKKLKYTFNL